MIGVLGGFSGCSSTQKGLIPIFDTPGMLVGIPPLPSAGVNLVRPLIDSRLFKH
jgi:hypothetical protein